jgi:phospholipid/cholesterol/gamma-HCH transport system permease protein
MNNARVELSQQTLNCLGSWEIHSLHQLDQTLSTLSLPPCSKIQINGQAIQAFDSAGALVLLKLYLTLQQAKKEIELIHFQPSHLEIFNLIKNNQDGLITCAPSKEDEDWVSLIGRETINKYKQAQEFIGLVGDLSTQFMEACSQLKRFQWPSIVSILYSGGLCALPILALLSFLIGVVLAYQMGLQLKTYGANIFIAYLSGLAIFREFGPLITAIIVAGRTSSSFTAQIGSMVVNEEVDAIEAMGLSSVQLLVLPKVIALTLIFPLLIFWSDVFSVLGSMLMAKAELGVSYMDFLHRLQESVGRKQFFLGLYKAPTFAILIALVGCFQGLRVHNSTDSIGLQTTKSVVQALFLIIIADAIYSILYSWMDL